MFLSLATISLKMLFTLRHAFSIHNILYGNTFLLALLIINVHMYTFQIVYTRYYMCTCRPDRTVLRNVHFDLRVFNTIRKKI